MSMRLVRALGLLAPLCLVAAPARADLILSELIVELQPGGAVRRDVEIWNDSTERSYVAVQPREILNAGLPGQSDRRDPDPEKLGLLVTPARLVLEPGQRRLVRIASISADPVREHVYRVTVAPVGGKVAGEENGLKVLVGYDVLVLVRPARSEPRVRADRTGRQLTFTNAGNVSVELVEGRQCAGVGSCRELPGKRLYPGAVWTVELGADAPADYVVKSPGKSERRTF